MSNAPEYAIVVKNKTRLEALIERFNTKAQAKFYIESLGGDFNDYELEHENFQHSLSILQRQLSKVIKNKIIDRAFLPSFLFNEKHVVVVIGQDGLVANTAKYVNNLPIIAVNPDVDRFDGFLLPFTPNNFVAPLENVLTGTHKIKVATLAEASLNDGQRLLAFNDLFIGASSHVSARYKISYGNKTEEHSSSGIIVATNSGSTGWLSSVFNMVRGINGERQKGKANKAGPNSEQVMFVVREPFLSKKTQAGIVSGILEPSEIIVVQSYMPTGGVIFSDGIETDFLRFNSGAIATIRAAKEKALLVTG